MNKIREILLFLFLSIVLYLLFWPVPVDPVIWEPPHSPALEGDYTPNNYLINVERFGLGDGIGPEDVDVDSFGNIYTGYEEGEIIRYKPDGSGGERFAHTGGRPLGLEFDKYGNLIVADALEGLLSIDPLGKITVLTTGTKDVKFGFADDLDISPDGTIYFSDASSKTGITDYRHDIVDHRPYGGLFAYDPQSKRTYLVQDSMYFANGVAVSPEGDFVLVNETSEYRVRKVWIKGNMIGKSEILMDGLPGFPDGISSNGRGIYWIALPSRRQAIIDDLSDNPIMRKMILRLPEAIQPAPQRYGFILGIDGEGNVVHNLQDPSPDSFSPITSVEEHDGMLYLGSLTYSGFARIRAPE